GPHAVVECSGRWRQRNGDIAGHVSAEIHGPPATCRVCWETVTLKAIALPKGGKRRIGWGRGSEIPGSRSVKANTVCRACQQHERRGQRRFGPSPEGPG